MKKILLVMTAVLASMTVCAQQIAVVKGGETKVYNSLKEAFEGAESGSVVYLPGGGFRIADTDTIRKKLTIIGITHKATSDNVDGRTTITGNLIFGEGSTGSALMGCYVTGNVNIGTKEAKVSDILLRYNNINAVLINNSECINIVINQNYIRNSSDIGKTNAHITNNIVHSIKNADGAYIAYNVITSYFSIWRSSVQSDYYVMSANNSTICNNVILSKEISGSAVYWRFFTGSDNDVSNNMVYKRNWGNDCVNINVEWTEVFEKNAGVNTASKYHFINDYKEYEGKIGIYAGTGFSDDALPPVPYIKDCKVDEQTDAEGKLKIRINVKAVTE